VKGKGTQATKVRDLSSDIHGTGCATQHFGNTEKKGEVIDLEITGLQEGNR
jgi:hypothetical protein